MVHRETFVGQDGILRRIGNPPQITKLSSWPRAATKVDDTAGAAVAHTLVCAASRLISMPAAIVLPACREESRHGTQECVRHGAAFVAACDEFDKQEPPAHRLR